SRVFNASRDESIRIAEVIWDFVTTRSLLIENRGAWKLDHERISVVKPVARYVCDRCGITIAYSVKNCCLRKGCRGDLVLRPFDHSKENIIARWVAGISEPQFSSLKSEEHTAQINKTLAKQIEDRFRDEEPRPEGVNLLSSTTTFKMGFNIGDLQKIL